MNRPSLNSKNTKKVVKKWIKKWKKGVINFTDFDTVWRSWIPKINNPLDITANPLHEVFISLLDKFIFYGYSSDFIDKMCKREESTTCSRASTFEYFSYYFECNECIDLPVNKVLCINCYENSEHRTHDYTMRLPSDQYCSCGDSGTWENTWYCTMHADLSHNNEESNFLPQDVKSRASMIIVAIIYANDLLNSYKGINQPKSGKDNEYCLILHANGGTICVEKLARLMHKIMTITPKEVHTSLQKLIQEGRIIIKLPKSQCEAVKANLKDEDPTLSAIVLHDHDVIHHEFVLSLLTYLQKCLKYGNEFREIFSKAMLKPLPSSNQCLAENFLTFSSALPRAICDTFNELLMFGTFKNYETKKSLLNMIIERYDVIMNTEDLKINISNSVLIAAKNQLFSIPRLAHYFIANENAVSVIFTAFFKDTMKTYEAYKNSEGFNYDLRKFNRSYHHLSFIKTLIEPVPKYWTNEIRKSFLNGLTCFLQGLNTFQGIDSATRRTENHVEYELTYDPYRTISSCLITSAKLVLPWCEHDDEIFNEACEETLKLIDRRVSLDKSDKIDVRLLNHSTECLTYNSEIHPVSIHLYLFRFLVKLMLMQLERTETLLDTLKTTTLSMIFDSVLKIHAMMAQYSAGMWILNGLSAEDRVTYYCQSHCSEIFVVDIKLLQIAASQTEPNKFLIKVLEKYGLIDWANPNFEKSLTTKQDDKVKQVIHISEQFLKFLIVILIERNFLGISYDSLINYLEQEIIHCLCIKPSSRQEINDFFMMVVCNTINVVVDRLIEKVAIIKSAAKVPLYELKKEFYVRYNPLYYHYDPKQACDASAFQRQRRKAAGEPDCFPPCELPKLKQLFHPMVNIFQSDVMLHIMRTVIERSLDSKSISSSETQLQNVLYLIGYALQEEKSGNYPNLCFTKKAAQWKLFECLEKLLKSNQDDLPTDLLQWTMGKYNQVLNGSTEILLPVSAAEESEKLRKSQLIAAKRDQAMQTMAKMQNEFLKKNSMYNENETINQSLDSDTKQKLEKTCILCQETQTLEFENNVLVMPGFVQYSSVLCVSRKNLAADFQCSILSSNLGPAFYTSSCGHVMHTKCLRPHKINNWKKYYYVPRSSSGLDVNKREFFCPLCKTLSNVMIPLLPPLSSFKKSQILLNNDISEAIQQFTNAFQKTAHKNVLQVWKSLSYTIHVIETLLRKSNKPILGHLSSGHRECLQSFIKIAAIANLFYPSDAPYNKDIKKLRLLFITHRLRKKVTNRSDSHLRSDIFSLFVIVLLSKLAVIGGDNYKIFRLVFVAKIVQIILATNFDKMVDNVKTEDRTPFKSILQMSGKKLNHLSENFIWLYIQKACIPFLRCCVLFYSFLNDGPSPLELTELGGDTFSNMCSYLGFPQTREELFHKEHVHPSAQSWFDHRDVKHYLRNGDQAFGKSDPRHINQLVKLPNTYFEIIKKSDLFMCPSTPNKVSMDAHICLICGEIICTGFCCEEYVEGRKPIHPMDTHLKTCGSALYLKSSTSEIILQPLSERVYVCAIEGPYLDRYKEGDRFLARACPLYLSVEKYKQIHTLMLSHGIFEKCSQLSRPDN